MWNRKLCGLAVVLTVLAGGSVYRLAVAGSPEQKDPPTPKAAETETALRKAMLEDARKVFEADIKRFQGGVGNMVEDLYLWSGRWLEAELDLAADATAKTAALKSHLDRMKVVEKAAEMQAKAGQGRESDAAAGRYYRAQAELWLARGRVR